MEIYGLLGEKLGHSLSPEIHKDILEKNNMSGVYKLFEVPKMQLENFVIGTKLIKVKGVNVTIPYKESIMKYLDYISDEAERIGAVNTVLVKNNKLYGYNTDYFGIEVMLKIKNIIVNNKIAVILGSGGACKAMVTYLLDNNIEKIYIVSRTPQKVTLNEISEKISIINYKELINIEGDIIINSTPVGMYPNIGKSVIKQEIINKFDIAIDLIYNPEETEFLKIAKEQGKITVGGLYMLVGQAVKSQSIYNENISIDFELIDLIYNNLLIKELI